MVVHRRKAELVGEVAVLAAQSAAVVVVVGAVAITLRDGFRGEQPSLAHKHGFYLEKVVAVVGHIVQRDVVCPGLKGIAIDAETVVACQRDEVGGFPRAVASLQPLSYGFGLLFQPLGLQCAHPAVYGEAAQRRNDVVTGRVFVGGGELDIAHTDVLGHAELELRRALSALGHHVGVYRLGYMQYHVVVSCIALMAMLIPVGRTGMDFDVAHPQGAVDAYLGVEEVGSGIGVVQSRVYHLDLQPVGGGEMA